MITNRKLLAFLALVLIITAVSCAGPSGETTAEVRVQGSAGNASARSINNATAFVSGEVIVAGEDITGLLEPTSTNTSTGTNDIEFSATVTVPNRDIPYQVNPRPGFVFDEWEINRAELKKNSNWRSLISEIKAAIGNGEDEIITIAPELIRYIKPTFERGVYFDLNAANGGDGSKESPYNSIEQVKSFVEGNAQRHDDDVELTIKFQATTGTSSVETIDFNSLGFTGDDTELELRLIGGFDADWNRTGTTAIQGITAPSFQHDDIEFELEFRNMVFEEIDHNALKMLGGDDDDFEIDFRNSTVQNLKNVSGVINGLIVRQVSNPGNNLVFINSDTPYLEGATYIHSIVRDVNGTGTIKGMNNIVVAIPGNAGENIGVRENNIYVTDFPTDSYRLATPYNELLSATPLREDDFDDDGNNSIGIEIDDDILEEDIEGRERLVLDDDDRDRGRKVSYGPYEYQWFDD